MRRTRDVVNDRDLLYIDANARTVNYRSVEGWKPCRIWCMSSKDLIVQMDSNDGINSKDVLFQFDIIIYPCMIAFTVASTYS